jgi:hypothetical protein
LRLSSSGDWERLGSYEWHVRHRACSYGLMITSGWLFGSDHLTDLDHLARRRAQSRPNCLFPYPARSFPT